MEQARDDMAVELASGTPNYANAVAGAVRYCPMIAHVLQSLETAVRTFCRGSSACDTVDVCRVIVVYDIPYLPGVTFLASRRF